MSSSDLASSPPSTSLESKQEGRVLLPQDVTPSHYDIFLSCDLERFTFNGSVKILCDIEKENVNKIVLHARDLLIKSVKFCVADAGDHQKEIAMTKNVVNIKLQTIEFEFDEMLPVGKGSGQIWIDFVGEHNNQMAGFYRSFYNNINGEKKVMVSTQFESLDARRAFPCWDEPGMKATFDVTLEVPVHLTAFSNMPEVKSSYLPKGRKVIKFSTTPVMSTYLVAFVVGEFDFIQSITKNGVTVRIYTPPGKASEGEFALDCACKCLDLYDEFFQIPYPLPKLDMVAIPEFAMGAMENWGCVTYREVDLLIDSQKASSMQQQRVAIVVAHELAHQWFGNLVTMQWWDDLWLNEGFASWTENYAVNTLYPSYRMWDQFGADTMAAALNLDALRSSHPIQVPIYHAEEVEEVFDAISYCKGACVVRMIYAVLGHADFQAGLQVYMNRYQYGNTETFQLWGAWEEVSGKPIGTMMKSWTEQMGYPMITIHQMKFSNDDKKMILDLEQQWFLADGSLSENDLAKVWTIPLIISVGTLTQKYTMPDVQFITDKTMQLELDLPKDLVEEKDKLWIKFNVNQESPYRVLYPSTLLGKLSCVIENNSLQATDRAGLLLDCLAFTKTGNMGVTTLLKFLTAYSQEEDCIVWDALSMVIKGLRKIFILLPAEYPKFAAFVSSIILPQFKKIGGFNASSNDSHTTKILRGTLISMLSDFCYEDEEIIKESRRRYEAFTTDPIANAALLPNDYKESVYSMVIKNSFSQENDVYAKLMQLWTNYETEGNTIEQSHIYASIGNIPSLALKKEVLDWTNKEVKLQDFSDPIYSVSNSGYEGLVLAWTYYQENFQMIKGKLQAASASLMDSVIVYSCGGFAEETKANEIEAFFKENPLPLNQRKIAQVIERVRVAAKFKNLIEKDLQQHGKKFWSGMGY